MKHGSQYEQTLTNEELLKRFINQFELVRYAIRLAENTLRSGKELDTDTDSTNLAFQILSEIEAKREKFQEIPRANGLHNGERGQAGAFFQKELKKERKQKPKMAARSLV